MKPPRVRRLMVAPPGTDPADQSKWTKVGTITDFVTTETDPDDDGPYPTPIPLAWRGGATVELELNEVSAETLATLYGVEMVEPAGHDAIVAELSRLILGGRGPARPELRIA